MARFGPRVDIEADALGFCRLSSHYARSALKRSYSTSLTIISTSDRLARVEFVFFVAADGRFGDRTEHHRFSEVHPESVEAFSITTPTFRFLNLRAKLRRLSFTIDVNIRARSARTEFGMTGVIFSASVPGRSEYGNA